MILITRPRADSILTGNILKEFGISTHIEPMFYVRYLTTKINIKEFDVVIATSKNSIISLRKIIDTYNGLIITVGDGTKDTAVELGFDRVVSLNGTVYDIVPYIRRECSYQSKIIYIRGKEITCDLKNILQNYGFIIQDVVLYTTVVKKRFSKKCCILLENRKCKGVVLYSSRTAEIFVDLLTKHNLLNKLSNTICYAMSEKISDRVQNIIWQNVLVAQNPTQKSLISLISKRKKNVQF